MIPQLLEEGEDKTNVRIAYDLYAEQLEVAVVKVVGAGKDKGKGWTGMDRGGEDISPPPCLTEESTCAPDLRETHEFLAH